MAQLLKDLNMILKTNGRGHLSVEICIYDPRIGRVDSWLAVCPVWPIW